MKKTKILAAALLCACCFSEEGEAVTGSEGSSESKGGSEPGESEGVSSTSVASTSSSAETSSSEDGTNEDESTSESSDSDSSSDSGSDSGEARFCSFSGASCETDADCGIPGVCYAPTQGCFHWCASNDDCPEDLSCWPGEFGSYCISCGEDDTKCAGGATCGNGSDCAEENHEECVVDGMPCVISESCLLAG